MRLFCFFLLGFDGSLHIVPALFPLQNSNASLDSLDCDWSFEDITSLPPLCSGGKLNDLVPTALAWWDRLDSEGRCRYVLVIWVPKFRNTVYKIFKYFFTFVWIYIEKVM